MMTAIDWRAWSEPWRSRGPLFAREVKALASGAPISVAWCLPSRYRCSHCEEAFDSHYALNAHQNAHRRDRR